MIRSLRVDFSGNFEFKKLDLLDVEWRKYGLNCFQRVLSTTTEQPA